eukprot:1140112-Pelagomonas_calceolata.AAC.1
MGWRTEKPENVDEKEIMQGTKKSVSGVGTPVVLFCEKGELAAQMQRMLEQVLFFMHATKFGPKKSPMEDLEAVRGYHANTFALRIIYASHACRVDFWENEGGWSRR